MDASIAGDAVHRVTGEGRMPESTAVFRQRPALVPERTAIVVIDMVRHQVTEGTGMLGGMARDGVAVDYIVERLRERVIPNIERLIAGGRSAGATVAYVRAGCYRADFRDAIPPFRSVFRAYEARDGSPACNVVDRLSPRLGDIDLIKTGSGGFTSSNLDSHLRNLGIEHVLYTGVVTNGCVLLTVGAGLDLGYHGYLVADATATFSARLQEVSEELIGGFMAQVVTTEHMLEQFETGARPRGRAGDPSRAGARGSRPPDS